MRIFTLTYFVLVMSFFSEAQTTTLSGKVIGSNSKKAIPYANIGFKHAGIGTVSDVNGFFTLDFPDSLKSKPLTISSVGYVMADFEIETKLTDMVYHLSEDTTTLKEVEVKIPKNKVTKMGNFKNKGKMTMRFKNELLGNEIAMRIKLNKPGIIEDFNFKIDKNQHDTLTLRLNIYDIKDGIPHQKILTQNVIINTSIQSGLVTINLEKYNLIVLDDFIVSLEWIKNLPPDKFNLGAGMYENTVYFRAASLDNWKVANTVAPEMYVTVTQ